MSARWPRNKWKLTSFSATVAVAAAATGMNDKDLRDPVRALVRLLTGDNAHLTRRTSLHLNTLTVPSSPPPLTIIIPIPLST